MKSNFKKLLSLIIGIGIIVSAVGCVPGSFSDNPAETTLPVGIEAPGEIGVEETPEPLENQAS